MGRAQHEANRAGAHQIDTDHLLIGVCEDDTGPAGRVLRRAGVTPEAIRALAAQIPGLGADARNHIPCSSQTEAVLEMAKQEASWRDDEYVTPDHILLAVLMLGEQWQTAVLGDLGVDDASIKAALGRELHTRG